MGRLFQEEINTLSNRRVRRILIIHYTLVAPPRLR